MNIMADKIGQYLRNKWNFGNRRALFPRDQYYMWAPGTEPQIAKSVIVVNSDKQPVGLPGDRVNVSGFTRTTPVVTTKSVKPSNTELKVPQIDTNEYAITTLPKDIATAAEPSQDTIPYGVELPQVVTPTENPTNYTIQSGDTLGAIAKKYGVALSDLAAWNNIEDPNRIYAGQTLITNGKPGATQQTTAKSMTSTKQQVSTPVRRDIPMENMTVLNVPTTIPSPSAITMPVNTNVKSMMSPDKYILNERDRRRMLRDAQSRIIAYQQMLRDGTIDRNDADTINKVTAEINSLLKFLNAYPR